MRALLRRSLIAVGLGLVAGEASARLKHHVPAYEPTDLELEEPHTLELNMQFGMVARDADPKRRIFIPDYELDFGLTERVELDLDGALSLDRDGARYYLSHDTLWTSVKLDLATSRDELDPDRVWALGTQLGPRLPTAPHTYGSGFGVVLLGARMAPPWHVILNAGATIEPLDHTESRRSAALQGGVDLDFDLDRSDHWSLLGELAGGYSLGPDPHDVHATLGIDLAATDWLDLSVVGFYGFLSGGDRYGLLLGIAPKFALAPSR